MSFFGGGSSAPPPPPALPEPLPSPASFAAGGNRAKPAGINNRVPGFASTLMTGGGGVDSSSTNTERKSLLGQ